MISGVTWLKMQVGQHAQLFRLHARLPGWFIQDPLDQQWIDLHQAQFISARMLMEWSAYAVSPLPRIPAICSRTPDAW